MVTTPGRLQIIDQGVALLNHADRNLYRLYDSILTGHGFTAHTDYLSRNAFTLIYRPENVQPHEFALSYLLTILPDVHAVRPVYACNGHVIELLDLPTYTPFNLRQALVEGADVNALRELEQVTDPGVCSRFLGRLAYATFDLTHDHYQAFLDYSKYPSLKMSPKEQTSFNRAANCILGAYSEPTSVDDDLDADDTSSMSLSSAQYQLKLPNALTVIDWCLDAACSIGKKTTAIYTRRIHPSSRHTVTQKGLEIQLA